MTLGLWHMASVAVESAVCVISVIGASRDESVWSAVLECKVFFAALHYYSTFDLSGGICSFPSYCFWVSLSFPACRASVSPVLLFCFWLFSLASRGDADNFCSRQVCGFSKKKLLCVHNCSCWGVHSV